MTAGLAVERVSRQEFFKKLDASKERMGKALQDVEAELKKRGYRLRGTFDVVELRTGFYLRSRRE